VELSDSAFDELARIVGCGDGRALRIELEEGSEKCESVLSVISADTGKRPCRFVGVGVRRGVEFLVKRRYIYTPDEIDHSRFLLVLPTPSIAEVIEVTKGVPEIRQESWDGKAFGALFPSWRFGVSRSLGDRMREQADRGSLLYWLNPTVQLPRSELELCDSLGKPISSMSKGCFFVSESEPVELVYDAGRLGEFDFDVAYTQERIGVGELVSTQLVVVSQNFRRFLESEVPTGLEFAPVKFDRLV
jgi:hypothetical protein